MIFFQEEVQDSPGWEERGENVMKTLNPEFSWKRGEACTNTTSGSANSFCVNVLCNYLQQVYVH